MPGIRPSRVRLGRARPTDAGWHDPCASMGEVVSMVRARALGMAVGMVLGLGWGLGASFPGTVYGAPLGGADTVLVVVDSPPAGSSVGASGVLRGWAADPAVARGSGVDRVEAYLDGDRSSGVYLGTAAYGSPRPDVARNLGAARLGASGFALPLTLPPGPHTIYVYAHTAGQPSDAGWSDPTTVAVLVGAAGPRLAAGTAGPSLPPAHCIGIPAPFGVYGLETPQSYGAIYPTDVPFVFGDPAFWATYGAPGAPAYIDFGSGTVYPNAYFYQPRPARGIPIAC